MIQQYTRLIVADNSGAKSAGCIKIAQKSAARFGELGDVVTVSIKSAAPRATVKKKEVHKAVIVRQRKPFRRADGSTIRFDDNAVILINPDKTPKGTRVFGPIARELRERGYTKIISMAQEVI